MTHSPNVASYSNGSPAAGQRPGDTSSARTPPTGASPGVQRPMNSTAALAASLQSVRAHSASATSSPSSSSHNVSPSTHTTHTLTRPGTSPSPRSATTPPTRFERIKGLRALGASAGAGVGMGVGGSQGGAGWAGGGGGGLGTAGVAAAAAGAGTWGGAPAAIGAWSQPLTQTTSVGSFAGSEQSDDVGHTLDSSRSAGEGGGGVRQIVTGGSTPPQSSHTILPRPGSQGPLPTPHSALLMRGGTPNSTSSHTHTHSAGHSASYGGGGGGWAGSRQSTPPPPFTPGVAAAAAAAIAAGGPSPAFAPGSTALPASWGGAAGGKYAPSAGGAGGGVFLDLLDATRKAFAAGMGEWDLQALEWGHPAFADRLLKGPIGPEALKRHWGMAEADILRLYRVLYMYSVGFCAAVLEPTAGVGSGPGGRGREALLEAIFAAYAALWDEALGISFRSELAASLRTKGDAVSALGEARQAVDELRQDNAELQERLSGLVRGNIDSLLAYRSVRQAAEHAQGEADALASVNDALAVKIAGAEMSREGLVMAAEDARKEADEAQVRRAEAERRAGRLKAALAEQQGVAARLAFQLRESEARVVVHKREAEAARAEMEAAVRVAEDARKEAAGAVARAGEATRSYALLHSDWVVKGSELDDIRVEVRHLQERVAAMVHTHETATAQIEEACVRENSYRQRLEATKMHMADLEATNAKLVERQQEVVRAYWPLMTRLKEVEGQVEEAQEKAAQAGEALAAMAVEVSTLRAAADAGAVAQAKLHALEQQMAGDEAQLLEGVAGALPPAAASRVRAFLRSSKRKARALTDQLMALVDVQAVSAKALQEEQAGHAITRKMLAAREMQLQEMQGLYAAQTSRHTMAAHARPPTRTTTTDDGHDENETEGAASMSASLAITDLQSEIEALRARVRGAEERAAVAEVAAEAAAKEVAERDVWLREVAKQAGGLATRCDELLAGDPLAPRAVVVADHRGEGEGEGGKAGSGGREAGYESQQGGGEEGASGRAGDSGPACSHSEGDTSAGQGAQAKLKSESESDAAGGGQSGAGMAARVVATGPLAVGVRAAAEKRATLVVVDTRWEELGEALGRVEEWGQELMSKRADIMRLGVLEEEVAATTARAKQAEAALAAALERAQAVEGRVEAAEAAAAAARREAVSFSAACSDAGSARAALEAALQGCRAELSAISERSSLMEAEYWQIKSRALEMELGVGEIKSARDRAVTERAHMAARVAAMQAEVEEHRAQRAQLERDVVGLRAWVRTMQGTERAYRGQLEALAAAEKAAAAADVRVKVVEGKLALREAQLASAHKQCEDLQAGAAGDNNDMAARLAVAEAEAAAAKAEVAEAEARAAAAREAQVAAEASADQAVRTAQEAAISKLEMASLLAEARRAAEAAADVTRHTEAEVERLRGEVARTEQEAVDAHARADAAATALLGERLAGAERAAERGAALSALVDARLVARENEVQSAERVQVLEAHLRGLGGASVDSATHASNQANGGVDGDGRSACIGGALEGGGEEGLPGQSQPNSRCFRPLDHT